MGAATIQQMADRVSGLIEEKFGIRGPDLGTRLRKAGGRLPAAVRTEARYLDAAAVQAHNPKLLLQIDDARVAAAYDTCVRHLGGIDPGARRRAMLMGLASSVAFSIFAVGVLTAAVLWWRGLL